MEWEERWERIRVSWKEVSWETFSWEPLSLSQEKEKRESSPIGWSFSDECIRLDFRSCVGNEDSLEWTRVLWWCTRVMSSSFSCLFFMSSSSSWHESRHEDREERDIYWQTWCPERKTQDMRWRDDSLYHARLSISIVSRGVKPFTDIIPHSSDFGSLFYLDYSVTLMSLFSIFQFSFSPSWLPSSDSISSPRTTGRRSRLSEVMPNLASSSFTTTTTTKKRRWHERRRLSNIFEWQAIAQTKDCFASRFSSRLPFQRKYKERHVWLQRKSTKLGKWTWLETHHVSEDKWWRWCSTDKVIERKRLYSWQVEVF